MGRKYETWGEALLAAQQNCLGLFFFPSQRPKYLHIIRVLREAAASQDTEGELPPFPLSTLLLVFFCLFNFRELLQVEAS